MKHLLPLSLNLLCGFLLGWWSYWSSSSVESLVGAGSRVVVGSGKGEELYPEANGGNPATGSGTRTCLWIQGGGRACPSHTGPEMNYMCTCLMLVLKWATCATRPILALKWATYATHLIIALRWVTNTTQVILALRRGSRTKSCHLILGFCTSRLTTMIKRELLLMIPWRSISSLWPIPKWTLTSRVLSSCRSTLWPRISSS